MFDKLQNKFSKIFNAVKGHGKISEKNISDAIREIRIALLESDVNFKVVSKFIKKVKENALGVEVLESITPGQQFIKIVKDELVKFLSSNDIKLNIKKTGLTKIVVAGLQGSGKTTTSAKIARFLKREQNKKPLLIAADLQRLAAQEQLKILSDKINVDVYLGKDKDPVQVVNSGLRYAKSNNNDIVIIDTAGRLHIDELLMDELDEIIKTANPDEILYVIDGMTGQDAVNSTKVFSNKFSLTGAIITKMDGNSGGGAALSVREIANCPIKFMTTGENIENIEIFDPERIAKRILGLADIVGLVEKAQEAFDESNAKKIQEKIKKNEFDFNDFLDQIKQFNKLGSMSEMTKFIPGLKKVKNLDDNKDHLKWTEAIINSMTSQERLNPAILNGSRKARIAKGSGRSIVEVNRLLKQFSQIKVMMNKASKMKFGKFPFRF